MQLSEKHIGEIKEKFKQVQTVEDFVQLLNLVNKAMYGEKARVLNISTFYYYADPKKAKKRYQIFQLNKKSGGKRTIYAPVKTLLYIQRAVNVVLTLIFEPHHNSFGFIPEKSIVHNAEKHVGMNYVFNTDLSNFFPSIDLRRVLAVLKLPPFSIPDSTEHPLAFLIANICSAELMIEKADKTKEKRKVLPQGAPTSPTLSNMITMRLDKKLTGVAKRFGLNYSRYADDITFSSMHNVFQENGEFRNELEKVITGQGFSINPKKTRLQKQQYRQEVTGLVVNQKVNTTRRYTRQIRMWLYYWETYGYNKANQIFLRDYFQDKGHIKKKNPTFMNVLLGKLDYLKMVKGEASPVYQKLSTRFDKLALNYAEKSTDLENLENLLNVWENKGMDEAIKLYNKITKPNG